MIFAYIAFTCFWTISYVYLIIFILKNWDKQPIFTILSTKDLNCDISIIIPARNEENNIGACLNSIIENEDFEIIKPEVIVVNDHSIDDTIQKVNEISSPNIVLLNLKDHLTPQNRIKAYKKAALNLALTKAKGSYIIQLDADVIVPTNYLKTIISYIKYNEPNFLACPVVFNSNHTLFKDFQTLDFIGMMALTQAGIFSGSWYMANGANMVYRKENMSFDENGLSSGDDVFGIQKFAAEDPSRVFFAKNLNASVKTDSTETLREFYNQRIRWATKNKYMKQTKMQVMMLIPFVNAFLLILHLPLCVIFGKTGVLIFMIHLFIKMSIDYVYLKSISQFFKEEQSLKSFLPANFFHIIYICFIGFASLFISKYNWKDRRVE